MAEQAVPEPITAIISYARGNDDAAVLRLAQRLRRDGIACTIDQFVPFPAEGFDVWMEREVRTKRWVLVLATAEYYRRAEGKESPGKGLGVIWEYGHIRQDLYQSGRVNTRFVPIGFGADNRKYVPLDLQQSTFFDVSTDDGYIGLLRVLTEQPAIVPEPVGSVRKLPPVEAQSEIAVFKSDVLSSTHKPGVVDRTRYEADADSDREFLRGFPIVDTIGRFDITVFPGHYNPQRILRTELQDKLRSMFASYAMKSNVPTTMPFESNAPIKGFRDGVEIALIQPQWKRLEVVRLHTSGSFRLFRLFEEDYGDDGIVRQSDLKLWMEYFVERVTLIYMLARNVCRSAGLNLDESVAVKLSVGGLQNRDLVPFDLYPDIGTIGLSTGSHSGTEREHMVSFDTTTTQLNEHGAELARRFCADVFWNFGLAGPRLDSYMKNIQRRLVGGSEVV